uniref:Kazal-like domain-containing protein n=1 Tax=Timema bartmani TaxID=61472 RepID=A0A7R9F6J7_9NEOP|nr:unnamed protein product [Timema bartmani]
MPQAHSAKTYGIRYDGDTPMFDKMAGVMLEVEALSVRYKPPPKECPTTCSDIWEPVCAGEDLYTIRTFQNLCSVELQECNTKLPDTHQRDSCDGLDTSQTVVPAPTPLEELCLPRTAPNYYWAAKCVLSGEEVVTLTPKQRNTQVSNITIGCPGHKSYQVEGLFLGAATRRHSTVILCERQLERSVAITHIWERIRAACVFHLSLLIVLCCWVGLRRGSPSAGYAASLGESREGHAGHMTEGWSLIGSPPDPTYGFFTLENVEHLSYASLRLPSQL